ncbi:MAG: prefoldin subunit alpha [Euryarchaeota archaeon]|nr:prefoldin subunit alpha [Euryarchaeota archaeon]
MSTETKLKPEQVVAQYQALRSQAEALRQNIELILSHIAEFRQTLECLEELDSGESVRALVPLGSGAFVNAELGKVESVVLSIGADVAVRRSVEEAKRELSSRIEELEKVREEHTSKLNEVLKGIEAIAPLVEQIVAAVQRAQQERGDVQGAQGQG